MKANLALTLVGAALISLPAMAQTTSTPPANNAPRSTTSSSNASAAPMYEMKAGQWRATKLAGLSVYNNNNEKIGDVNELIIDRDGKAQAAVIGVGGFLGMGEHLAAVPWDKVKWVDTPRETTTSRTTTTGSGTTTAPSGSATTTPPAAGSDRTATDRPAATITTTTRDAANRGYPDHAVVDMTKEQLKALPEVKYAR
jgi:sporulation protein YlmC with PRC-barrel domain